MGTASTTCGTALAKNKGSCGDSNIKKDWKHFKSNNTFAHNGSMQSDWETFLRNNGATGRRTTATEVQSDWETFRRDNGATGRRTTTTDEKQKKPEQNCTGFPSVHSGCLDL